MCIFWSLFTLTFLCGCVLTSQTTLNVTVNQNPDCNLGDKCKTYNVMYINARNTTSSVHIFITASRRFTFPSVLIVHSSLSEANPKIEWEKLDETSGERLSIKNVTQSYALVFYKMLEYNDLSDSVNMSAYKNDSDQILFHPLNEYTWDFNTLTTVNSLYEITYNGSNSKMNPNGGQINLKFRISTTTERSDKMPHLLFLPGLIVQYDVVFNNLTTHFNQSRFSLQLVMISSVALEKTEEFRRHTLSSIDDEVTPGNFETINLLLNEPVSRLNTTMHSTQPKVKPTQRPIHHHHPPAFIQTKPLCFIDDELRTVQNSRNIYLAKHQDNLMTGDISNLSNAFPSAFYADRLRPDSKLSPVGIRMLNISFGSPMDGFYANSKYIVWTASFGLGDAPTDSLSSLLIGLIIFSTVIVLCSVIIGSVLTVVMRRRVRRPNNFSQFVNDPVA
uniref:Uncharacterized protein n=1 Tax=Trichobilharzia regenti TaxID=157069 RepID=A0AA85IXD1_TRIRE|nr:unnamed protein product [Trichobilharzia regenti]